MDSFSEKLKTVLSDPESMAKITEIAKGFAAKNSAPSLEGSQPAEEKSEESGGGVFDPISEMIRSPVISEALRVLGNGSRERVALLSAMRPFVKEEKKQKLDKIISTMKTLDLITSAQKLL